VILNQVENELQETTHSATNTLVTYMEQIEAAFRAAGITVPLTSNEKGERSESWSTDYEDVGGAVNVYGLDSYPGGFSCTNPNTGFTIILTRSRTTFQNLKGATSRPGAAAFTMTASQNMNLLMQTYIIKTILGRELPCRACIWVGEVQIGAIVSFEYLWSTENTC